MNTLLLIGAVCLVLAIWAYNRLVALLNKVRTAWSDVDVQLQRRADLIPNLVTVVKQYADHEARTLEELTARRARGGAINEAACQETAVSGGLLKLLAVVESYPQLQADERFAALHQSLLQVENDIQSARRYFNGATRDYNTLAEQFPWLLVARLCGFGHREFFEIELATQRAMPEVRL